MQPAVESSVYPGRVSTEIGRRSLPRLSLMRIRAFIFAWGLMLTLGMAVPGVAQDNAAQQPSARQQLQDIHTPESIDQQLARLTKDLELTPKQQQQVRPLLQEHHEKIEALLNKN